MAKIKCSICSYQFNIWYGAKAPMMLIWFLVLGQGSEVYLTLTTGCLGLALLPTAAHAPITEKKWKSPWSLTKTTDENTYYIRIIFIIT